MQVFAALNRFETLNRISGRKVFFCQQTPKPGRSGDLTVVVIWAARRFGLRSTVHMELATQLPTLKARTERRN